MEKECPICGKFFETDNKNRKYCDSCKDNPSKAERDVIRGYKQSYRRMYEPIPENHICDQCGKEFVTIPGCKFCYIEYLPRETKTRIFCSKKCKDKYKQDRAKCAECGKSLADNKRYNPNNTHDQYCSYECELKAKRKRDIANGRLKKCQNCGKEFIRKDGYFCSQECYREAFSKGWKTPKEKAKYITAIEMCKVCKKEVRVNYDEEGIKKRDPRKIFFCSDKCKEKYNSDILKKDLENTVKILPKSNSIPKVPLCTTCKTSYKDCERMQSDFRIIPNGARYKNGILFFCPKYK